MAVLKVILQILGWIFNVKFRNGWEIRWYQRGSAGARFFTTFFTLLFLGLTVFLEYWFALYFTGRAYVDARFFVLLLLGVLIVAMMYGTIERGILFSIIAFGGYTQKAISAASERRERKKDEKEREKADQQALEKGGEVSAAYLQSDITSGNYKSRGWDLVVGILHIAAIVGVIACTVFMLQDFWTRLLNL